VIGADEPWRFVTAAFLHSPGSYLHIIANMIALWMVGPFLETALGRTRYLTLYLLSAVAGSVACLVLAEPLGTWYTAVVGASGAVFGLFGAVLVVLRRLQGNAAGILGVIVLNVVIGFVVPGIAWQAHLGGLVVGAVLGAAYAYAPPARRAVTAWLAPLAVGAALLVATVSVYSSYGLL
jgi:membrane associated rhomboid family serine protease